VRTACDFLGQMLSLQLDAHEHHADFEHRMRLKSVQARLLASMANEENFVDGLVKEPDELLGFAAAGGAAVLFNGQCLLLGTTPDEPDVHRLADWLSERARQDVYSTDSLAASSPRPNPTRTGPAACWRSRSRSSTGATSSGSARVRADGEVGGRPHEADRAGERPPRAPPPQELRDLEGDRPAQVAPLAAGRARYGRRAAQRHRRDRARKAEELAQLSAELKRSNRELEAFSYSVSHDLRAPFRHIVGYSELLLEEGGLSEQGRRFANTIIESARYAGSLVDNLLAFSQMGRTAIRPSAIRMDALVEEVRRDVMQEAEGRRVAWDVGPLPDAICDPLMMRLALRNLLSNAVKYTRNRAEAAIAIGGEALATEVVYWIRDNGTGFDMRYVDKLFGVFQRLHRMEDFEGTGIGPGQRPPDRRAARRPDVGGRDRRRRGHLLVLATQGTAPGRGLTMLKPILLVEDNPKDLELTLVALGKTHLANEVVVLRDGAEALDYLACAGTHHDRLKGNPAVVLLDLKLPKVDGLQVLEAIKGNPDLQSIPVVMLTSSREERDLLQSYKLGVNAYVVKPVGFKEFLEVIQDLGIFWAVLNEPPPGSARFRPK
jgi:signal transduction histidine kinase/CheY-like chemotaxis protein